MDRETWQKGTYYYQMTEIYGEIDQLLRYGQKDTDRKYIEKVKENPIYAQKVEFPRTHLQHAIAFLQWSYEDPKNKWRKWKIKRDIDILLDYFYDNERKTKPEKLRKYWVSYVFKWQKEMRR